MSKIWSLFTDLLFTAKVCNTYLLNTFTLLHWHLLITLPADAIDTFGHMIAKFLQTFQLLDSFALFRGMSLFSRKLSWNKVTNYNDRLYFSTWMKKLISNGERCIWIEKQKNTENENNDEYNHLGVIYLYTPYNPECKPHPHPDLD